MAINNVINNSNALQLIATAVASNSAALTFINLSANFYAYQLVCEGLLPGTGGYAVELQLSNNNGSTWTDLSLTYSMTSFDSSGTPNQFSQNNVNFIQICGGIPTSGAGYNGQIMLIDPMNASKPTSVNGYGLFDDGVNFAPPAIAMGFNQSAGATNGVRLIMSTGNIATGTVKLYGIRA